MSEKKQETPIEIPLEEILKDFEKFQRIKEALEKNENPFKDRENKKSGGSVGSLMDIPMTMQTAPTMRYMFNVGRKDPNCGMRFVSAYGPVNIGTFGHSQTWKYKKKKKYEYY